MLFADPPATAPAAPPVQFLGIKTSAKSIVYMTDPGGRMIDWWDDFCKEMIASVDNLVPEQSFNLVYLQELGFGAVDKSSLLPANSENKHRAHQLIETFTPHGETDPMPALKFATTLKPDLIYLLTYDGFTGPGDAAVVDFCKRNFGKTRICTIGLVAKREDKKHEADSEWVKAIQAIAKNSGGQSKLVAKDDKLR